ncbi:TCP-1/cpn60 chaperonin family protein, partial [Chlamydia psittaci 84-8471/1]
KLLLLI